MQNRSEEKYNEAPRAARNTVGRCCFEVWKQHFQCLLHGMTCKLGNVKTTILARAVLYNIAVDHGDMQQSPMVAISMNSYHTKSPQEVARGNANTILQTFKETFRGGSPTLPGWTYIFPLVSGDGSRTSVWSTEVYALQVDDSYASVRCVSRV